MGETNNERARRWFVEHIWTTHKSSPDVLATLLENRETEIRREEREACARLAEEEPELPGPMPEELEGFSRECLARSAVRTTKRNIAAKIRSRGDAKTYKEVTHGAPVERPELGEGKEAGRADPSTVHIESPAEKPTDGRGVDAASNADVRGDGHVVRDGSERRATTPRQEPRWTVLSSVTNGRWTSRCFEFFDDEQEAEARYNYHLACDAVPTKRPYYAATDREHLGAGHDMDPSVPPRQRGGDPDPAMQLHAIRAALGMRDLIIRDDAPLPVMGERALEHLRARVAVGRRKEVIEQLCKMMGRAYNCIDPYGHEASDCVCRPRGMASDYRNDGHALTFMEVAISDAIARHERAGGAVAARLDPDGTARPKTEIVGVVEVPDDDRVRTLHSHMVDGYLVRGTAPPRVSPTKTSAEYRRRVREGLHKRALDYLNSEDREDETGHDRVSVLVGLLEDAWDEGYERCLATTASDPPVAPAEATGTTTDPYAGSMVGCDCGMRSSDDDHSVFCAIWSPPGGDDKTSGPSCPAEEDPIEPEPYDGPLIPVMHNGVQIGATYDCGTPGCCRPWEDGEDQQAIDTYRALLRRAVPLVAYAQDVPSREAEAQDWHHDVHVALDPKPGDSPSATHRAVQHLLTALLCPLDLHPFVAVFAAIDVLEPETARRLRDGEEAEALLDRDEKGELTGGGR